MKCLKVHLGNYFLCRGKELTMDLPFHFQGLLYAGNGTIFESTGINGKVLFVPVINCIYYVRCVGKLSKGLRYYLQKFWIIR